MSGWYNELHSLPNSLEPIIGSSHLVSFSGDAKHSSVYNVSIISMKLSTSNAMSEVLLY